MTKSELQRLYDRHRTIAGVAVALGCSFWTARQLLNKHQIKLHQPKLANLSKQQLINLCAAQPVGAIAKRLGVTTASVYRQLTRLGVVLKPKRFADITAQWLQTEYVTKGRTASQIATELGCSRTQVYNLLKRHGITPNKAKRVAIVEHDLRAAYDSGLSRTQLAAQFNCCRPVIDKLLCKYGIEGRTFSEAGKLRSAAISQRMRELWQDPAYRDRMQAGHVDIKAKMHHLAAQQRGKLSKPQQLLYTILNDLGVKHVPEHTVGHWSFDCYLPDHSMLIECQGDYWHSLPETIGRDAAKATYIARYHPELTLKYVWEHEFCCKDRVIDSLKTWTGLVQPAQIDYDVRKLVVTEIDRQSAESFIARYHYAGRVNKSSIRLGAHFAGQLVGVCVFSQLTRLESNKRLGLNHRATLELSRFALDPCYQITNAASCFLAKCTKHIRKHHHNLKLLITFADETFNHTGTIYRAAGWQFDGYVKPSYWYVGPTGHAMHKKTMWDKAKKMRKNELEYAAELGYRKVVGKRKRRFILWL